VRPAQLANRDSTGDTWPVIAVQGPLSERLYSCIAGLWWESLTVLTSRLTSTRRKQTLKGLFAAGVAACAGAVAITLSGGQASNPALEAEVRAAIVAAPIFAGLYVWSRDPWTRFAKLLVAFGFALSLTTLAGSSNEIVYSAGRVFGWLVEPLLIFLVLAFPSGRLTSRVGWYLVAASALLVALLYVPTALVVDSYPSPSPMSACNAGCPGNAFMVIGSQPGFVNDLIVPFREAVTMILLVGVIAVLAARIRSGTLLMRITVVPVLTVAIVHSLALIGALVVRRAAPDGSAAEVLSIIVALSWGAIALGFLAGLSAWRLFENRALRRVAAGLASHPPALTLAETGELLSETIDPSLELFHRPPGGAEAWLDMKGKPASPPLGDGRRCLTEVTADDGHLVAVVHDLALRDTPTFTAVIRSSVLKALENERLGAELRASLRELRESRARIMSSADRERQRIERDIHDGAQQSLVSLRIRLELASHLLNEDPDRAEQLLTQLAVEVDRALEEVRSLARGVYPSLLADRGLGEALRSVAMRSPVSTTVEMDGIGRYPADVEAAVYFCCLEAMQNAMKHAAGVEEISVSLSVSLADGGTLSFDVTDDGAGFVEQEVASGAGLTSMRDRLAALGGDLTIVTAPSAGTRVAGAVPLDHLTLEGMQAPLPAATPNGTV
jgi:signal transduction histidine kinase